MEFDTQKSRQELEQLRCLANVIIAKIDGKNCDSEKVIEEQKKELKQKTEMIESIRKVLGN